MFTEVKSQTFGNTCWTLLRRKWRFQWLRIYQLEDMEDMQVAVSRLGLPEQDKDFRADAQENVNCMEPL